MAKILYKCKDVGETENVPVAALVIMQITLLRSLSLILKSTLGGGGIATSDQTGCLLVFVFVLFLFYSSQFICISNPHDHLDQQTC